MLAKGLEVPVSFVGQRGIFEQDGLEGEQGSGEQCGDSTDSHHLSVTLQL